jgi:hypothetical protein
MRDLRKYARQTNLQLATGFLLILLIVGDGLIYIIWWREAAMMGVVCILAGLAPLVAVFLILWGIEKFIQKNNQEGR